jgi:tRNA threonylcarbamoyladenosine biosynthesis protein TsaB
MLLALETSDKLCAACLIDEATGNIAASRTIDIGRGHSERMIGLIGEALGGARADYKDLTGLAACVGPGSFTGIRVSLATATGLSIALNLPVRGVTSLQALALEAGNDARGRVILALVDARRGDVYAQMFSAGGLPMDAARQITLAQAGRLAAAPDTVSVGSGVTALKAAHADIAFAAIEAIHLPHVDFVAHAALNPAMTVAAKPLYLRRPDAKPQEAYTVARALR